MIELESREIAIQTLVELNKHASVELEINFDLTEHHSLGFVYFYNAKAYWATRDWSNSVAGNGPLLVLKSTGKTVFLPSSQSVEKSIAQIEADTSPESAR